MGKSVTETQWYRPWFFPADEVKDWRSTFNSLKRNGGVLKAATRRNDKGQRTYSAKTIRDPVHGDIMVFSEDLPLLDAPQMQRLRGIRQLGSAFLVYPGAQHTRFEHSLGTYHLAQQLIDRLSWNHERDSATCRKLTTKEASIVRAVALLHDITHIPHGHALEDQDGLFPRHDTPGLLSALVKEGEIGKNLAGRSILKPVAEHLSENGARGSRTPFLSLISNGPVGTDMLDYLRRDGYFIGLRLDYDNRILDYVKIDPRSGTVYVDLVKHNMDREDILTEIINLLRARYVSSERIYYHHAKLSAGALISRAVELAILGGLTRDHVAGTTDSTLAGVLRDWPFDNHPLPGAKKSMDRLLMRFEQRRLLKRCFVFSRPADEMQTALVETFNRDQGKRMMIEKDLARTLGVDDPAEVIVYCPGKNMQLKEARVPVRRVKKGIRPLAVYQKEFPALRQLVEAYRNLWKLYVFVPFEETDKLDWAGKRVQRVLRKSFPGISNEYQS